MTEFNYLLLSMNIIGFIFALLNIIQYADIMSRLEYYMNTLFMVLSLAYAIYNFDLIFNH